VLTEERNVQVEQCEGNESSSDGTKKKKKKT
jgi:hypothetical protein